MRTFCTIVCLTYFLNASCQIDSLLLEHDYYTLQNGLEVVLQPDKNVEEVSVEFWLRDGTSIDQPKQYGLQHFFEHIMPYAEMDSINENKFFDHYLKGSNAQVKKDFSRFYLKVVPEGLELALQRASGRLKAGAKRITENRIEYQRKRVLAEIERNAKNPHWSAEGSLAIYEGTFGKGHPYAANGYGKIEYNKNFSLDNFRQRYNDIVYSNNIILFVVGDFNKAKAKKLIQNYFSDIKSKPKPTKVLKPVSQLSEYISMQAPHPKDSINTMVFSWAISEWEIKDDAALKLIAAHLNNFFKTENSLPKSVFKSGVYTDMYKNAGQFYIRIQFSNSNDSDQINKLILDKVDELVKKNMTEQDLINAKKSEINDIKDMQRNLGFQWSRTELLGKSILFKGTPNAYYERLKQQQQLTTKQVKEISLKWLEKKPFRILFKSNI
nr:insulinase family protein [uncultured Psychroserpens sp.]